MASTVNTTFTFSSTDISSDTLSFTVSEALALTGSGGLERVNLISSTNSGSGYTVYNAGDFNTSTPTHLYVKNVTSSGYSGSAGGPGTSSVVHLVITGSNLAFPNTEKASIVAKIHQGNFAYLPIDPDSSYEIYAALYSGLEGSITASHIVEFGVFN